MPAGLTHGAGRGEPGQGVPGLTLPWGGGGARVGPRCPSAPCWQPVPRHCACPGAGLLRHCQLTREMSYARSQQHSPLFTGTTAGGALCAPCRATPCRAVPRRGSAGQGASVRGAGVSVRAGVRGGWERRGRLRGRCAPGDPAVPVGVSQRVGGVGSAAAAPPAPPGHPAPARPRRHRRGGVCVCVFFYSLFHSFQKRLVLETSASCPAQPPGTLPAPRPAAGSPGTTGAGCTPGAVARGHSFSGMRCRGRRDAPTRPGACQRTEVVVMVVGGAASGPGAGSQGRGQGAAVPPAHAAPARPAQEGASCLKPHPRHSSQRHPGGISRGAWAGLESKASLPAPAGRPASPGSSAPCRAVPSCAVPAAHPPAHVGTHMDAGPRRQGWMVLSPPSHSPAPAPAAGHRLRCFHHDLTVWPAWGAPAWVSPGGAGAHPPPAVGCRRGHWGQGGGCPPALRFSCRPRLPRTCVHTRVCHTHVHTCGSAPPPSSIPELLRR